MVPESSPDLGEVDQPSLTARMGMERGGREVANTCLCQEAWRGKLQGQGMPDSETGQARPSLLEVGESRTGREVALGVGLLRENRKHSASL